MKYVIFIKNNLRTKIAMHPSIGTCTGLVFDSLDDAKQCIENKKDTFGILKIPKEVSVSITCKRICDLLMLLEIPQEQYDIWKKNNHIFLERDNVYDLMFADKREAYYVNETDRQRAEFLYRIIT